MNDIILFGARLLGHVKEYLIRYELQHYRSLHAHIILWIEKDDVDRVTNKITVVIPTTYDDGKE
jgi:hypothetical protein